jgi:hypothetical protein
LAESEATDKRKRLGHVRAKGAQAGLVDCANTAREEVGLLKNRQYCCDGTSRA